MSESTKRIDVAALARDKGLPAAFLRKRFGLYDLAGARGGVGIPYLHENGTRAETKLRTALAAREGSRWPKGRSLMPYNLPALPRARTNGRLILGEGESDPWTAEYHGMPCVGLPGASSAKCLAAGHLEGINQLLIWQEPDRGGQTFINGIARRLRELGWKGEAMVLHPPGGIKDLNDLHRAHPDVEGFKVALTAITEAAVPLPALASIAPATSTSAAPSASAESPLVQALRQAATLTLEAEQEEFLGRLARVHKISRGAAKRSMLKLSAGQQASEENTEVELAQARAEAGELLTCPDILTRLVETVRALGVTGEERAVKTIYLAVTSRVLNRLVSLGIKGPSSGGKNHVVGRTMRTFPSSAYHFITAMSERALAYGEEPLAHRYLILIEVEGIAEGFGALLLRCLLSEGCLTYETVEPGPDNRLRVRRIEREGPTGLIVTTTRAGLHPETETRLLSVTLTDSPEQTRAILKAQAAEVGVEVDLAPWHALQRVVELGAREVHIPFAAWLAENSDDSAVRLRRDFPQVLSLIRAHALLHQTTRERDEEGRVVATPDDYAAVHKLVADLLAEGIGATVHPVLRPVVEAVGRLVKASEGKSVTVSQVAEALDIERTTCTHRVRRCLARGWLADLRPSGAKNRPAELVPGEPMPGNREVLPTPDAVRALYPPRESSRIHASTPESMESGAPCVNTRRSRVVHALPHPEAGVNSRDGGDHAEVHTDKYKDSLSIEAWSDGVNGFAGGGPLYMSTPIVEAYRADPPRLRPPGNTRSEGWEVTL
jgi:hypothetical protein